MQYELCNVTFLDLQECCGCCSLGLQIRSEGHRCEAHQYLGRHCSHVFLACCEGEQGSAAGNRDGWHAIKEKPILDSTAQPKRGIVNKTHTENLQC